MKRHHIRILFWFLAVFLGGAQTWHTRHRIFSDGISYLEIAHLYAAGDWRAALNAYWSPLYSWVLAADLWLFRPSAYWDSASLHVVNFAAFLASCWVFEKFLNRLLDSLKPSQRGLSPDTLRMVGYTAMLHAGLLMIGIGYPSPDMLGLLLTAFTSWIVLEIARSPRRYLLWAILGLALALGFLDRTSFAPLAALYFVALLLLPLGLPSRLPYAAVLAACFAVVFLPFVVAISLQRGGLTLGESGKLNYAWEVDGAPRSIHWQGEPGDIGKPLHPTRLILKDPVLVYEFGDPIRATYPPWRDPSYWYEGIHPGFQPKRQFRVFSQMTIATAAYLCTTPAFVVLLLLVVFSKGNVLRIPSWPKIYWPLILPPLAGILLYQLVFVDKRYLGGFFLILWIVLLSALRPYTGPFAKSIDALTRAFCLLVVLGIGAWLSEPIATLAGDALHARERESNVSWLLAREFQTLGVKPGAKIAYVGEGMDADWIRLAGARIVAEVPVTFERRPSILRHVDSIETESLKFFQSDRKSRELVYDAFRRAGATIAVTNRIPQGGRPDDWTRVLDPSSPGYPRGEGQILLQSPGYYRWLIPAPRTDRQ